MIGDGPEYIVKTVRSACLVVAFVAFVLMSYGQIWAISPYLTGFGLGIALLYIMEGFIRRVVNPERLGTGGGAAGKEQRQRMGTLWFLGFALIKYPLVGLLIWYLVRIWDTNRLMVFAAGFLTLHLVMGMRAIGRVLTQSENK